MSGFRKFVIYGLIICQWLAFGGISIYHHFCTRADLLSQQFFIAPLCQMESCDLKSCCKKNTLQRENATGKSGCCRSESSFLKLYTDLSDHTEKPALFLPFFIEHPAFCFSAELPAPPSGEFAINPPLFFADLPPPETGAQKIIRLRKILC